MPERKPRQPPKIPAEDLIPRSPASPFVAQPTEDGADAENPATKRHGKVDPDPTRYGDWEIKGRCIDF